MSHRTMDLCICFGFFIFLSLTNINNCFGYSYKEGQFRLFDPHPNLRSCAVAVLQKSEYVGGRVSNLTGECQGLPFKWALNQTKQSGYAYAKKIMVRENFKPPLKIEGGLKQKFWRMIPGLFQKGAKLEVTATMPPVQKYYYKATNLFMSLLDGRLEKQIVHLKTQQSLNLTVNEFSTQWLEEKTIGNFPQLFGTNVKISFVSEENYIKILLNDSLIYTHYPVTPVTAVRGFYFSADMEEDGPTLSSLMYNNE